MKLPSIAFAAAFAIIPCVASSAGAEGHLEAYAASSAGGDAYFVRSFRRQHVLTMVEREADSHAGMLIVRIKDPRRGLTASNLLPLPPGRLKIVLDRVDAGDSFNVRIQSNSGHVVSENFANFAETAVNSPNSQQSFTVPIEAGNRVALIQLVRTNFFGLNTPAIAALEAQYEEMWAQDVAAMVGYHGGSSAAATTLFQQINNSAP